MSILKLLKSIRFTFGFGACLRLGKSRKMSSLEDGEIEQLPPIGGGPQAGGAPRGPSAPNGNEAENAQARLANLQIDDSSRLLARAIPKPKPLSGDQAQVDRTYLEALWDQTVTYLRVNGAVDDKRLSDFLPNFFEGKVLTAHRLAVQAWDQANPGVPYPLKELKEFFVNPIRWGGPCATPHSITNDLLTFKFLNYSNKHPEKSTLMDAVHEYESMEVKRLTPLDGLTKCWAFLKALPLQLADKARTHTKSEHTDYTELRNMVLAWSADYDKILREYKSGASASGSGASGSRSNKRPASTPNNNNGNNKKQARGPDDIPLSKRFKTPAKGRKMFIVGLNREEHGKRMANGECVVCGKKGHRMTECNAKQGLIDNGKLFWYEDSA